MHAKYATKTIAAWAILALAGAAFAQGPAETAHSNVARLAASGSVDTPQDLLTLTLNTTREGSDAGVVQAQLKQALDAALAEARKTAQPGQMEVRTGGFGLHPRYGKDGKVNGWQGSTELVLEGRDFTRITTAASRITTLTTGNVGFGLSREQRAKVEAEARNEAIERFRGKAQEIARAFGFAGYSLREVSVGSADGAPPPRPRMMAMEAKSFSADAAPLPVEAGKATVTVTVSGSVQMK